MAPRLGVEVAVDYDAAGFRLASDDAKQFGATVSTVAQQNLDRTVQQKIKLQGLAAEYLRVAASAKEGSVGQAAAADLAAKAQKRLGTEVLAQNALVRTSAKETAASLALSEREIGKFARGAGSATGGFGRTAALSLGSGGFLAGAAIGVGIKDAIGAAKALTDAQEQLAVATDNTGQSWDRNRSSVERYIKTESDLTLFTKAQLTTGLVGLERATGSLTKAEADETLASNIARGAHIDLSTATQDLINLEGGRTRGLVTLGVKIPIVKTATDALKASGLQFTGQQKAEAAQLDKNAIALEGKRKLLEKYAGSSKAFSDSSVSASDRLKKSVNDLATSLGDSLLPDLAKVENPLAHFIEDLSTGKGSGLAHEIHSIADEIGRLAGIANDALKPIGGFWGALKTGVENMTPLFPLLHAIEGFTGKKGSPPANMGLNGGATSPVGSLSGLVGLSPTQKRAYIASQAAALGLDPRAVLGVATAEGGFSGAVGDYGHAFGPFQLNNAGGVITGKFPGQNNPAAQAFANSAAGINYALQQMAKVAGGLTGMAAISAIVSRFERPANSAHDLSAASQFYFGGAAGGTDASNAAAIAALIAQGHAKKHHGKAYRIPDALEAKIRAAQQAFADDATKAHLDTLDGLLREEEGLLKQHGQQAKAQSIANEITKADTSFSKALAAHVKAQIQAVTASFAQVISADKSAITSAFGNIISDAQTAFTAATQNYITNTLGPKFSQGGLLTAKEQQYADMQAADTAKSLVDGLTAAQKQLADDMNGGLLEHVVDISTGKTTDIFGPQGSASQIQADQDAITQAQRMIDENNLSIEATAERKDADKSYADAVTEYQQERSDAEHAMTRDLTELGRGIADGKRSINDLPGILAQYGLDAGTIEQSSAGQFSDDMKALGKATQALADVMIAEALALNKLGDSTLAGKIADAVQTLVGLPDGAQGAATPGGPAIGSYYGVGSPFNPTQYDVGASPFAGKSGTKFYALGSGGDITGDGFAYLHAGERVQPAEVVRGSRGGGGTIVINVNAPHYVGSHAELADALKHPSVLESVGAAVALSSRGGHLKIADIRS